MLKRKVMGWIAAALVCVLAPALVLAESAEAAVGLGMAEAIRGTRTYPEGSAEEQAVCVLRYEYPQFLAGNGAGEAINAYYRSACDDTMQGVIESMEEAAELVQSGAPAGYVEMGYQVTANTDAYLSVVLTDKRFFGYVESERLSADVFALTGAYAGQPLTLSRVMEMEGIPGSEDGEAARLISGLVWQIIMEQRAAQQRDYYEDLVRDDLERAFNPETDFYMDMDGNLVFFVQSGLIASEVEGMLTYPFAAAELATEALE